MFLTLFHPGDLSVWELSGILAVAAIMLLAFVGLPLFLVGFIVYKVAQHRKDMAETKFPGSIR